MDVSMLDESRAKRSKPCCSPQVLSTTIVLLSIACLALAGLTAFVWLRQPTNKEQLSYPFFPIPAEEETRVRALIEKINAAALPWKAEYNPLASLEGGAESAPLNLSSLALEGIDHIDAAVNMQVIGTTEEHLRRLESLTIDLPESFDARDKWPRCASLHYIQNQGGCGSCWAAATAGVLSDRLCISSNGEQQDSISVQDLVSCCEACTGCQGAYPIFALLHWKRVGVVTGGGAGSNEGCRPYEIESTCGAPCPIYFVKKAYTPKCERKCQPLYKKDYQADLRRGREVYWLAVSSSIENLHWVESAAPAIESLIKSLKITQKELIKREIFTHGPVLISTVTSEAFMHYKSGVLTADFITAGHDNLRYGHVMRVIGWGRDEASGKEYWTLANSFGRQWGDNGLLRLDMDYMTDSTSVLGGLW